MKDSLNEMIEKLSMAGIIPVIKVDEAKDAVPLCKALAQGGLPVAEITFRTAAAEEAIRLVHEALPDVLLGAGTILTCEQADKAWAAGAGYIVSPGLNPKVVRHCIDRGYPVLPGCSSPTDIEAAMELGISTVKFFPAEALGGLEMIKALSGPYGEVRFVPTGGITPENIRSYLSFSKVSACGGSWMVPQDAIKAGDWARIERLAREAVSQVLGFELRHIGINCEDADKAAQAAQKLSLLTGWPIHRDVSQSVFVGAGFEVMKTIFRGTHGHIALACNSIERAMWHLQQRGFRFDLTTLLKEEDGTAKFVYVDEEIAGFALHLVRK